MSWAKDMEEIWGPPDIVPYLREVTQQGTPGHWVVYSPPEAVSGEMVLYRGIETDSFECTVVGTASGLSPEDALAIVTAHNHLPILLDRLEKAERENRQLHAAVDELVAKSFLPRLHPWPGVNPTENRGMEDE